MAKTESAGSQPNASAPRSGAPRNAQPLPRIVGHVVLGWLVPGLGHFLSGHRRLGLQLFLILTGTFLLGCGLSQLEAVSWDLHPYYFWAEVGLGGFTLPLAWWDPAASLVQLGTSAVKQMDELPLPPHGDTGLLFCAVAGLLNVLVLFDLAERLGGHDPRRRESPA